MMCVNLHQALIKPVVTSYLWPTSVTPSGSHCLYVSSSVPTAHGSTRCRSGIVYCLCPRPSYLHDPDYVCVLPVWYIFIHTTVLLQCILGHYEQYLTLPHLTSPHLAAPHLTSPHLASFRLTSPRLTSPHLIIHHSWPTTLLVSPYMGDVISTVDLQTCPHPV